MKIRLDMFSVGHQNDFVPPVGADEPLPRQKICIETDNIDSVQQSGQWRQMPVAPRPVEPDHDPGYDEQPRDRLAPRLRRNPGRVARQEVFVVHEDRYIIQMKSGNTYQIAGSFDAFCDMLTDFDSKKETV